MEAFRPVIRWWTIVTPRLIAHFTEVLEVHADRLTYRKGVFNKSEVVIPFSRITNYSADQRVVDRIFGAGDFRIETAGSTITPELMLKGYPYRLREVLARAIERNT